MTIQLSTIKRFDTDDPITAPIEYPGIPGFRLTLQFASQVDTERFYGTEHGGEARDVSDDEFRDFHLERCVGWNVMDGVTAAPLDRRLLEQLWKKDGAFRSWLTGAVRKVGNFLQGADTPPPLAVGPGGE